MLATVMLLTSFGGHARGWVLTASSAHSEPATHTLLAAVTVPAANDVDPPRRVVFRGRWGHHIGIGGLSVLYVLMCLTGLGVEREPGVRFACGLLALVAAWFAGAASE